MHEIKTDGDSAFLMQMLPTPTTKPKPYFSELKSISGLCEKCDSAVCPPRHYGCCYCEKGHWRDEDWAVEQVISECADFDDKPMLRSWW